MRLFFSKTIERIYVIDSDAIPDDPQSGFIHRVLYVDANGVPTDAPGGGSGSGTGFRYEQDTDPTLDVGQTVAAGDWWADTANKIIYRRNTANDDWDSWTGIFGP